VKQETGTSLSVQAKQKKKDAANKDTGAGIPAAEKLFNLYE
jgi:hypothetical protein